MSDSPFTPPTADVESEHEPKDRGSVWKGVITGGAVDLGGTLILVLLAMILYIFSNSSPDMSPEDLEKLIETSSKETAALDNIWGITVTGIGLGISVLGGYICAMFAKEQWKKAVLILISGMIILSLWSNSDSYSTGVYIALCILSFASMYFGGWLRGRNIKSA